MAKYSIVGSSTTAPFFTMIESDTGKFVYPASGASLWGTLGTATVEVSQSKGLLLLGRLNYGGVTTYNFPALTNAGISFSPALTSMGTIHTLLFSPSGNDLVVGAQYPPYLSVYNTTTWTARTISAVAPAAVVTAEYNPDGSKLAVGGSGSPYLRVFNTSDWSTVTIASNPGSTLTSLAWSPDGTMLACGHDWWPYYTVYNTSTWTQIATAGTLDGNGARLAWTADGTRLAAAYSGGNNFSVLNTSTWARVAGTAKIPTNPNSIRRTPDGAQMLITHPATASGMMITTVSTSTWAILSTANYDLAKNTMGTSGITSSSFAWTDPYYVRGTVLDVDGNPAARTVRAYRRTDGVLAGTTLSDATTGEYELKLYGSDTTEYDLQFMTASGEILNDLFFARATGSSS